MSCYFVAQIRIHNRDQYKQYEDGFDAIFANYRGEVIAVDDGPTTLEGQWGYTRCVIIRFPGEDDARRWYDSPEYQALAEHRWQASHAEVILVHGRP